MARGLAWLAILELTRSGVAPLRRQIRENVRVEPEQEHKSNSGCELCLRETEKFTVHHLVPRSRGGKFGPKAKLCPTCHRQLHALFSESTLAKELDNLERIRSNPDMASYLRWVRKQKGLRNFRARQANHRQ